MQDASLLAIELKIIFHEAPSRVVLIERRDIVVPPVPDEASSLLRGNPPAEIQTAVTQLAQARTIDALDDEVCGPGRGENPTQDGCSLSTGGSNVVPPSPPDEPEELPSPQEPPPSNAPQQARITLGEEHVIEARVVRRQAADAFTLLVNGATKQVTATFGSSNMVGTLLNLLLGGPPVLLAVRKFQSSEHGAKPDRTYLIQSLAGLHAEWWREPSAIQYLQGCMDELWAFAPEGTPADE
jgi:hypothetical protein